MRTAKTPEEFVGRLRKTAENLGRVPRDATNAAALIVKTSILSETGKIVPDFKLSGTRGSGAIGVRYIEGIGGDGNASTLVLATGPFHLIERPTKPHTVYPRGGSVKVLGLEGTLDSRRRTKRKGRKALSVGGSFYSQVAVAGTKGQHPFEHGVNAARPKLGPAMQQATRAALMKELA